MAAVLKEEENRGAEKEEGKVGKNLNMAGCKLEGLTVLSLPSDAAELLEIADACCQSVRLSKLTGSLRLRLQMLASQHQR